MTMLKIYRDGTFESVAATVTSKTTYVSMIRGLKAREKSLEKDLTTASKIVAEKKLLETARTVIAHIKAKPGGSKLPTYAKAVKQRDQIKEKIAKLTASMTGGKFQSVAALKKKMAFTHRKIVQTERQAAAFAERAKKRVADAKATPKAKNPLPMLDGPKPTRTPKDHGAAFERTAKKLTTQTTRDVKGSLAEHAKTSLIRIPARPGAQAPKATVATKTAKSIAKPLTKQSDSATSSVLKVIKQIKADLAATKPGPKADRLRADLAKNRKHLRELRAGKTAKNQATINPKTSAKVAGMGTQKLAGKDAMAEKLKLRIKNQRALLRTATDARSKEDITRAIARLKDRLARLTAVK